MPGCRWSANCRRYFVLRACVTPSSASPKSAPWHARHCVSQPSCLLRRVGRSIHGRTRSFRTLPLCRGLGGKNSRLDSKHHRVPHHTRPQRGLLTSSRSALNDRASRQDLEKSGNYSVQWESLSGTSSRRSSTWMSLLSVTDLSVPPGQPGFLSPAVLGGKPQR